MIFMKKSILSLTILMTAYTGSSVYADSHDKLGRPGGQIPTPSMFTAVVEPGKGATCNLTPCRIYYRTPDLDSPVKVVANNFPVGTFEPGKYADLGNYNDPSVRITVPGSDVPTAYVNIIDSGNSR